MIHPLTIPPIAAKHLEDIVLLQIDLLYFAASEEANEGTCASYLDNHPLDSRFKGHGRDIADWLWGHNTSKRHEHLKRFASTLTTGDAQYDRQCKMEWCLRLQSEVRAFSDESCTSLKLEKFMEPERPPNCKDSAAVRTSKDEAYCFLLYFYEEFLEGKKRFPAKLFTGPDAVDFGRQDFLKEFLKVNDGLEMCPLCDESRFYSQGGDLIHTQLDHFLPKSLYPHLACHPYNLIPICHTCNSSYKGSRDPFDAGNGGRRALNPYILPYRLAQFSRNTFLDVQIGRQTRGAALQESLSNLAGIATSIYIRSLLPHKDTKDMELVEDAIRILSDLYRIPDRWAEPSAVNRLGETLFRRMRQFLDRGRIIPHGYDLQLEIYTALEQLLYYLDQEDLKKDPSAFALTWILVALINEELISSQSHFDEVSSPLKSKTSSLLQELEDWFNSDFTKQSNERSKHAKALLAIPQSPS